MKMKKTLSAVLAALTVFTLCSCSVPKESEKAGDKLAYVSENILYPGSKSIFINYLIHKGDGSVIEIRYTAGEENKFLVYDDKKIKNIYSVYFENGFTYYSNKDENLRETGDMFSEYWNESDIDFSQFLDSSRYTVQKGEESYRNIMFDYEKFTDENGDTTVFYFNQSTGLLRYRISGDTVYDFVAYADKEDTTYWDVSTVWRLSPKK